MSSSSIYSKNSFGRGITRCNGGLPRLLESQKYLRSHGLELQIGDHSIRHLDTGKEEVQSERYSLTLERQIPL